MTRVLVRCPDFEKEVASREQAELWIARVEGSGNCRYPHEIIEELEGYGRH